MQSLVIDDKYRQKFAVVSLALSIYVLELCWVSQIIPHTPTNQCVSGRELVMRRRQSLTTLCTTSFEHQSAILARHTCPKAMGLCASTVVRLKCSLRHRSKVLLLTKTLRLIGALSYVKKRGSHFTGDSGYSHHMLDSGRST
jgi:hypothetical protein